MLTVAYGEATLDRSNVYRWYKMFSEGREDVNDEERAGRPSTLTTDENIDEVKKIVLANRRITVREVVEDLNISIGSCHSIFTNDLGMRRVAAKFVPKLREFLAKNNTLMMPQPPYSPNLAPCDFFLFPKLKRPMKGRRYATIEEIKTASKEELNTKSQYRDPEDLSLLHDNAPSHTSLIVHQCLARNRVSVLNHPSYSPDLAPCDFSLFPKLKLKLKGRFFDDIPTIQSASTQVLEAIPQTELEHAFESLLNCCNKCIEARGEYFE
ncbi:SETMR methyltransferase, partial [Acromyrmex charruanus]